MTTPKKRGAKSSAKKAPAKKRKKVKPADTTVPELPAFSGGQATNVLRERMLEMNRSVHLTDEKLLEACAEPEPEPEKRGRGQPTLYRPEYARVAEFVCRRTGATDAELAVILGVTEQTINLWKKVYPDFSESLKRGKQEPDDLVERSLFERATGYSHPAVKVFQHNGTPVVVNIIERYPPDVTACIFWLKNRRKDRWRDTTHKEDTVSESLEALISESNALERKRLELKEKGL